jgi:hypothetical protein
MNLKCKIILNIKNFNFFIIHFAINFSKNFIVATLTLSSQLNVKCKGPWGPKMCLGVKHVLTNGGEYKGWSLMTPKCILTLGVTNFHNLGWKSKQAPKLGPQDTIKKALKRKA